MFRDGLKTTQFVDLTVAAALPFFVASVAMTHECQGEASTRQRVTA
jgi:hypothetical protein